MTCWFTFLCCILHSLSTDCFILLEHKTSKQIPISFLLPTLDVSLVMLRNTGSSTRRHALTQSENSHGSCHVFLLSVDVPWVSLMPALYRQTDVCTTEENVYSNMTCITSFGPHSNTYKPCAIFIFIATFGETEVQLYYRSVKKWYNN